MDGRRARLVRRLPFGEPLSGDERTSRKASLFSGTIALASGEAMLRKNI